MSDLPQPLTPGDCNLQDFPFLPLDVKRLRDSDLVALTTGDQFRCAVLLWCASWHQEPAASLPDDDVVLASLAGFGRVVKEWQKVRKGALRGWIKCSDGRLYHPVVAERANTAWISKLKQRLKTECSRIKKHNERHGTKVPFPDFDVWMSQGCPTGQPLPVPSDKPQMSPATDTACPSPVGGETHSKREGEGEGEVNPLTPLSQVPGDELPDPEPAAKLSMVMRTFGIKSNPSHPKLVALAELGVTQSVVAQACEIAKKAKPDQSISADYVMAIISNQLKQAAEVPAPAPAPKEQIL